MAAYFLLLAALVPLCSSCGSGRREAAPGVPTAAEAGSAGGAPAPVPMKSAPKPAAPGGAKPQASPASPAPPALPSPRSFSVAAPAGARMPADFAIGPLSDARGAPAEARAVRAAARAFLDALARSRIEESLVLPERLPLLRSLLAPLTAGAPIAGARIGEARIEGDAALAPVRLDAARAGPGPLATARATGELLLRRSGGAWLVEDLSVDATELARAPTPPGPAYEPAPPAARGATPQE